MDLNWSDKEFWQATPRKYFTCIVIAGERNKEQTQDKKVLTGSDAINDLIGGFI